MKSSVLRLLVLCSLVLLVAAWSKEDHEIFRLRDEVELSEGPGVTFYEFLGIKPGASQEDINKAYRKKSRTLHPDKVKQNFVASKSVPPKKKPGDKKKKPGVHVNKGPSQKEIQQAVKQASERFARLGVVTNILRGPERERYDHFLKNGFPKWRGTGYYYTRFRPGLGSVLVGLFLAFGGAAHYGALILSWKRQREFVDRYIRHARRAAWGDEMGVRGIPGVDPTAGLASSPPSQPAAEPEAGAIAMNRRQKRMMDKENRKEKKQGKAAAGRSSGTATPTTAEPVGPQGEKKRVMAENGKVLIVDIVGNVFLEEETEDGERQEFLLDIDEIPRPTWRDTMVYRFPVWVYSTALGRITGSKADEPAEEVEELEPPLEDESSFEMVGDAAESSSNGNGSVKKRNKRAGKR